MASPYVLSNDALQFFQTQTRTRFQLYLGIHNPVAVQVQSQDVLVDPSSGQYTIVPNVDSLATGIAPSTPRANLGLTLGLTTSTQELVSDATATSLPDTGAAKGAGAPLSLAPSTSLVNNQVPLTGPDEKETPPVSDRPRSIVPMCRDANEDAEKAEALGRKGELTIAIASTLYQEEDGTLQPELVVHDAAVAGFARLQAQTQAQAAASLEPFDVRLTHDTSPTKRLS